MKSDHPMLFKGCMVNAILAGRKTMTRRLKKPGEVGDYLWAKETFRQVASGEIQNGEGNLRYGIAYQADGFVKWSDIETQMIGGWPDTKVPMQFDPPKWKSPLFMPRWASRITLEVTAIREEKLQAISAKDIIAEGAVDRPYNVEFLGKCPVSAFDGICYPDLQSLWAHGWNSINKKAGTKWQDNPTIFVISFKRIK